MYLRMILMMKRICRSICNAKHCTSTNIFSLLSYAVRNLSRDANQDQVLDDESKESVKKKPTTVIDFFKMGLPTNLRLADDSTLVCARVIHPGLPIEAYDRSCHASLHYLLKATVIAGTFAIFTPSPADGRGRSFFDFNRLVGRNYIYVASVMLKISPAFYDYTIPKYPLEFKVQGAYVGQNAACFTSSMTSTADPKRRQLVQDLNQLVLVDRETLRPIPIDEDWRQQYQPHCVRGQSLVVKKQDVPSSGPASVYEVEVAWSDTDAYNHTNFASYVRFAVDAIYYALRHDSLDFLSREDVAAGASDVSLTFPGDCTDGDLLNVLIWPAESKPRTVVCSVEKGRQVICQVTISFHLPSGR